MPTIVTTLIFFFLLAQPGGSLRITSSTIQQRSSQPVEGDLTWKTLPEAIRAARDSHKKILVDVFTDWCTWCKKMDKEVYGVDQVQSYLTEHFELVKINAESEKKHEFRDGVFTEKQISAAFEVDGYPTTLFLTSEGELITSVPGYLKQKTFLAILEYMQGDHFKNTNWEQFSRQKGIAEE